MLAVGKNVDIREEQEWASGRRESGHQGGGRAGIRENGHQEGGRAGIRRKINQELEKKGCHCLLGVELCSSALGCQACAP